MLYLSYISFLFLWMQLLNTIINFVCRQKLKFTEKECEEIISVLIPARNEENNIALLLSDLQKIKNQRIEILVFDDQSTDNTAKIVQGFIEQDIRIRLIKSEGLPPTWLGKNYACYQLAQQAIGKQYLFIDADVRIYGNIVTDAVAYLKKYNLGLLSIFPTQIQKTLGEKVSVSVMNYILLTLLPLIFVRISPFKSHLAANGQCMLFDAAIYDKIQPHILFKDSIVEDITIAKFLKKRKINIACITSEKRIRCRMYQSYKEAVSGFSKNIFMFFGNMPVFAFLFWIFATFGFIPVVIAMPKYIVFYILGIISTQFFYAITSKQNIFLTIILFPAQMVFFLQVLVNGMWVKKRKNYLWKGRNILS